jgi:large conductance mechanosensitive channel
MAASNGPRPSNQKQDSIAGNSISIRAKRLASPSGEKDMFKGFRDFILRGNVVDLAIAFIMGAAFNTVVTSLVKNVFTPFIASLVGTPNFSAFAVTLHGHPIMIGNFFDDAISFLILSFVVYFFMVLPINTLLARVKGPTPEALPVTKPCPECLSEIPLAAKRCAHCAQPVA